MTPHNHSEHVPGCYRCELSLDEVRYAEYEDYWDSLTDAERDEERRMMAEHVATTERVAGEGTQ